MKDELGTRIKEFYEQRSRTYLLRRTYTMLRIDGKNFSKWTKGLVRPFDEGLIEDMDATAIYLCENIQGAKLSFCQSDEISILITDFDSLQTDLWFDGNVQKMVSISASMASAKFNQLRTKRWISELIELDINLPEYIVEQVNDMSLKLATFDSRVFQIPTKAEVENCFIWRQQDTVRNSIQSVAQSLYSPKELHNKNTSDLQEMIFQKGQNWNDYPVKQKRGRIILKESYPVGDTQRTRWVSVEPPTFTQDREFLRNLIPDND